MISPNRPSQSHRDRPFSNIIPTQSTKYLYDGWNVIEERTTDPQSAPVQESLRRYTWGLDLSRTLQGAGGVGGLLMAEELTATQTIPYYYNYDGNGNVTAITDSNGNNVATYRYTAFGRLKSSTGTYAATNTYRFSTKPQDVEVKTATNTEGLYYYGYRFYDPTTGRWPSRDPIEERGGINLYGFVQNNPIKFIDIHGLGFFDCCKVIAELISASVLLDLRIAEAAVDIHGIGLDPGHVKAMAQAATRVQNALDKVRKHCGSKKGAREAIEKAVELLKDMPIS